MSCGEDSGIMGSQYVFVFLSFQGAESLVVNGISQVLCISMADALAAKLQPTLPEKQVELHVIALEIS